MKLVTRNSLSAALTFTLMMASGVAFAGCPSLKGEWRTTGDLPDGRPYYCNIVVDKSGVLLSPSRCGVFDGVGNSASVGIQGVWFLAEEDGICRFTSQALVADSTVTTLDGRINKKGDVISYIDLASGDLSGSLTGAWHRMSN